METKINELNKLAESLSKFVTDMQPDENNWARLQALSRLKETVGWSADCIFEKERLAKK